MDYQKFKGEFDQSGLSQKKYAALKGISPCMVSYYLRKGRQTNEKSKEGVFSKLEIVSTISKNIIIRTTRGLEIEIPL